MSGVTLPLVPSVISDLCTAIVGKGRVLHRQQATMCLVRFLMYGPIGFQLYNSHDNDATEAMVDMCATLITKLGAEVSEVTAPKDETHEEGGGGGRGGSGRGS